MNRWSYKCQCRDLYSIHPKIPSQCPGFQRSQKRYLAIRFTWSNVTPFIFLLIFSKI